MIDMGEVEILREPVSVAHLQKLAEQSFGSLVKAVVDVDRAIMAAGADFHADEEARLLDDGSTQSSLWGINLYPADQGSPDWVEFDSVINLRPSQGNRTRGVDDPDVRERIVSIVDQLVIL